jgi:predicted Zn-dependent peptidase
MIPQQILNSLNDFFTKQLSDGSFGQSELLKTMLTFQKDISFYKKMITTIKSISKEEIQDLAVNYLDPNSMLSIVVGKKTE